VAGLLKILRTWVLVNSQHRVTRHVQKLDDPRE
jgi:hypothetical protein